MLINRPVFILIKVRISLVSLKAAFSVIRPAETTVNELPPNIGNRNCLLLKTNSAFKM